jgi:hypothetical protein
MSEPLANPAFDALEADAAEDPARALIERQLGVLGRLAEAGLNIALAIERQVTGAGSAEADAAPAVQGDVALAYSRVSRAVRLTIGLQARLLKDLQALDQAAVLRTTRAQAEAGRARQALEAERKARVQRIVERLILEEAEDRSWDEAEVESLAQEAYERLEHDDIYGDIAALPVSEIVARVCRDLGLEPDWARHAEEAWTQGQTGAEAPARGQPLILRWLDAEPVAAATPDPPAPERRAASP